MTDDTPEKQVAPKQGYASSWWDVLWFADGIVWLVTMPFRILAWLVLAALEGCS